MSHNIDFRRLFSAHYRELCLFATHFTADTASAEDIVQDCFVAVWEKVRQGAGPAASGMRAYLFTAVRNACLKALRGKAAAQGVAVGGSEALRRAETSAALAVTDDTMERSAREARLWTAIERLPSRCREVLLMAKRDGMTYADIAAELGVSAKTVEHELATAMRRLRGQREDIMFCLTFF